MRKRRKEHRKPKASSPPSVAATAAEEEEDAKRKRPHQASGFLMVDGTAPRAATSTPLPVAFKDASNGALADFLTRTAPDPSRPNSLANVAIYRQRRLARKAMREREAAGAAGSTGGLES